MSAATGALLVYAVWRSRDRQRYKVTPDVWGQVERFVKASAKRSRNLPQFIESLKPRLCCDTLNPRAMETAAGQIWYRDSSEPPTVDVQEPGETREFLTAILAAADERAVLAALYRETSYVVLLVRDRLERERPIETRINQSLDETPRRGEAE